ncbi:hypothetical protein GEMRC1_000844 [Eukaryota sp. GEM-RC1]
MDHISDQFWMFVIHTVDNLQHGSRSLHHINLFLKDFPQHTSAYLKIDDIYKAIQLLASNPCTETVTTLSLIHRVPVWGEYFSPSVFSTTHGCFFSTAISCFVVPPSPFSSQFYIKFLLFLLMQYPSSFPLQ